MEKHVYQFGPGGADGDGTMKDVLGGTRLQRRLCYKCTHDLVPRKAIDESRSMSDPFSRIPAG
jgi:hypothetical protein